jgi:chloramphenicol-sensitive protein RarD
MGFLCHTITWLFILIFRKKQIGADVRFVKSLSTSQRKKLVYLTLLASLFITGNWYSFIYAMNNVSLKSAAFAYMVCPLITAFAGFILLKEETSSYKTIGIILAIISIALLASGSFTDVLWSVFIASLYAFYLLIQRVIGDIDKLNMLGIQLILSIILILPFFFLGNQAIPQEPFFWWNIVLISIVFTIVPLFLSLYALIGMASSTLGIIIYVNPIIAFSVAFLYFQEDVTLLQLGAYSLLFFAVIVFNWSAFSQLLNHNIQLKKSTK